jgi:hypothetical protein
MAITSASTTTSATMPAAQAMHACLDRADLGGWRATGNGKRRRLGLVRGEDGLPPCLDPNLKHLITGCCAENTWIWTPTPRVDFSLLAPLETTVPHQKQEAIY